MTEFEKGLHSMFDHIRDCEIEHPAFQDTVGELMEAVLQLYSTVTSHETDLISRQQAINTAGRMFLACGNSPVDYRDLMVEALKDLPFAQPPLEEFEWCTDCKEYDQKAHCCHRYTKVIRKTMEELKVVRCKDCKWFGDIGCAIKIVDDSDRPSEYDFCSFAERKDNG